MSDPRRSVLDWAEQGLMAAASLPRALAIAGVRPTPADWRRFLDRLLLWMGCVLLAAGLVFFIAYNWHELGRYAKVGLVEAALLATLAAVWRLGLEAAAGRAALFTAALVVGALFALIGQTYQTGADAYELFATWALLILPWTLLGRSALLWLLWLALVNLVVVLYLRVTPGLFGLLFSFERTLWLLLAVNTLALAAWETAAAAGVRGLQPRWAPRLVATAAGSAVTLLAVLRILEEEDSSAWALPVWLAWCTAAGWVYRYRRPDLYVLAGGVLSLIVVVAVFFVKQLDRNDDAGAFLLVALLVLGLSAAGGWWLRRVAREIEA